MLFRSLRQVVFFRIKRQTSSLRSELKLARFTCARTSDRHPGPAHPAALPQSPTSAAQRAASRVRPRPPPRSSAPDADENLCLRVERVSNAVYGWRRVCARHISFPRYAKPPLVLWHAQLHSQLFIMKHTVRKHGVTNNAAP